MLGVFAEEPSLRIQSSITLQQLEKELTCQIAQGAHYLDRACGAEPIEDRGTCTVNCRYLYVDGVAGPVGASVPIAARILV